MSIVNTEKMLRYYQEFDAIEFKYNLSEVSELKNHYCELAQYESSHQFASLTKRHYADDLANLNLIYNVKEDTDTNVKLLDLILNKIIDQYINIDGIERLFSEKYIEFEWEMHLSADYEKHNMKFYRDHFFHQIRDAYMMQILLQEHGFYEKVKTILLAESNSKVSRFVCRCLEQQSAVRQGKVRDIQGLGKEKQYDSLRDMVLEHDKDFYIRNLIYMTAYMAALFHDIGYPEAYYITTSRHVMDYMSDLHSINSTGENMPRIYSLLQNSLLFRVVPFEEIERRLQNQKKPEHGTLSAVIFLLHFYENGAIHRLPPYKYAAVELAALAIYNHTNKYSVQGADGGEADSYRPTFRLNPLSYLLRICDDLQEWDRIYFAITDLGNILLCNRCRTPIVRKDAENSSLGAREYYCNCTAAVSHCRRDQRFYGFSQVFDKRSRFAYRRIYNISVCDKLEIIEKDRKLLVKLNYDTYKLLHTSYLHPTYAKYRIKELNGLKWILANQEGFVWIYLEYFVTSNPVHIKVRMLEQYLERHSTVPDTLKEIYRRIVAVEDNSDYERIKLFNELADEVYKEFLPVLDEFFCHQNMCKECSYCSNFVHALMKNNAAFNGSGTVELNFSCQDEMMCRSFAWLNLNQFDFVKGESKESLELIKANDQLEEIIKEKKLDVPDFTTLIRETDDFNVSIFYDDNKYNKNDCITELKRRCPNLKLRRHVEKAIHLYVELYLCQSLFKLDNMEPAQGVKDMLLARGQELSKKYNRYSDLQCLIEDCFLQFSRMYRDITKFAFYPDAYYKQYANGARKEFLYGIKNLNESEEYYYTAEAAYVSRERYVPYLEWDNKTGWDDDYIDAYSDLYFFWLLQR